MSADLCFTAEPDYILHKEYDEKPDIDKLHELFVIIYKIETPNYKKTSDEDEERYIFLKSLDKAIRRWKLFGPRGSMLRRIITDSDELNQLALDNDNKVIPEGDDLNEVVIPLSIDDELKEVAKNIQSFETNDNNDKKEIVV